MNESSGRGAAGAGDRRSARRLGSNEILRGVAMPSGAGEIVALLGRSGSGKTTLLRAVAGLETPHAAAIAIGEHAGVRRRAPASTCRPSARDLGLVFQSYALWPHKTVFDNVAYGLQLRRRRPRRHRGAGAEVLQQVGLGDLGARYPHQLSGGQQQRVAMARALVYDPPVILLDEPLSNLDAKLREEARVWLRELIVGSGSRRCS